MVTNEAEIIFASPKINPSVLSDLEPCIEEMNTMFRENEYDYNFRIIANEEYNDLVLKPILLASDGVDYTEADVYKELKIGQLAQKVLGRMLSDGYATDEEIRAMQTPQYSKQTFDLQYPLLVEENSDFEHVRYYTKPILIRGKNYRMCSQWFEVPTNNDRPYLLNWIETHLQK